MTSIRDRLAGKQRRRVVVPVQVSDPSEDQGIWMGAATALVQAKGRDQVDAAEVADLERQMAEAAERVESHAVPVEVQALPEAEWEAATAEWVTEDGQTLDWARALPALLAASCVDPDLQDAEWWAERLADPAWSAGDKDQLRAAILHLNVTAPDPRVPKG